jgi:hypothetical protein
VIPVLINRTEMPRAAELPAPLQAGRYAASSDQCFCTNS